MDELFARVAANPGLAAGLCVVAGIGYLLIMAHVIRETGGIL